MSVSNDYYDEIKHRIRKLKKLEIKIRTQNAKLVWDEFFDLHDEQTGKAKYTLKRLVMMDKEELKNVINEFFYHVYYKFYKENGMMNVNLYDPNILTQMGLPINADSNEIKKKFRELAKKYHPDTGGDSEKFIELMEIYRKLEN